MKDTVSWSLNFLEKRMQFFSLKYLFWELCWWCSWVSRFINKTLGRGSERWMSNFGPTECKNLEDIFMLLTGFWPFAKYEQIKNWSFENQFFQDCHLMSFPKEKIFVTSIDALAHNLFPMEIYGNVCLRNFEKHQFTFA